MTYICFRCHSRYPTHNPWCPVCQDSGTLMLEPRRPRAEHRAELQAASARELIRRKWTVTESTAYPEIRLGRGALVAVYGPPGGGKSTWCTRWADGLGRPVVYFSAEEKLGPTVGERLERCGVTRGDFHVVGQGSVDEVLAFAGRAKAAALVIDSISVTTIQPEELRQLREAAGVDVLAWSHQVTKRGEASGARSYLHEADVVIGVETMTWHVEKSRYQERLSGDVLPR